MDQNANSLQTTVTQPSTVDSRPKANNFLVSLLSILLLISVFIAGFFAYQTQKLVAEVTGYREQLKQTLEPITNNLQPDTTPNPIADWKTYTDNKLNISFMYPKDLTIRMLENGVVQFLDKQDEFVFSFNGIQNLTRSEFVNYKFVDPKEFIDSTGRKWKTHLIYAEVYNYEAFFDNLNKVTQLAFQSKTIDIELLTNQILSTFKFIEPVASSSPVACTMEAKICPDGSSVGRTGPKCEFASCPGTSR